MRTRPYRRLPGMLVAGALSALAYAATCGLIFELRAYPHDAPASAGQPLGWTYPFSCCSGIDCRPVAIADVEEGPDGYVIRATGEVVPYGDTRVKDSPDGDFHWCSVAGAGDGRTICLFVPPRGF